MSLREDMETMGAPNFASLVGSVGEEEAVRQRLSEMARNGDLSMLAILVNRWARNHCDSILSPIKSDLCDLERGGLLTLREFWWNLLRAGDPEEFQGDMPTAEVNPFAELTEMDKG